MTPSDDPVRTVEQDADGFPLWRLAGPRGTVTYRVNGNVLQAEQWDGITATAGPNITDLAHEYASCGDDGSSRLWDLLRLRYDAIPAQPPYDSRVDTLQHSLRVGELIIEQVGRMLGRATKHDLSKTEPPERDAFDRATPQLRTLTFGSAEYKASLADLGEALHHHYKINSHHPEHHRDGVAGMTLVDVVEMLADWKAATERHDNGDLAASLLINQERFGMSDELTAILRNTAVQLGWIAPAGEGQP